VNIPQVAQAAKVTGRSHTRIKKAIREKELTARKDGRATLIERAELQRWLAALPTIGRKPEQEPAHVAARGSAGQGYSSYRENTLEIVAFAADATARATRANGRLCPSKAEVSAEWVTRLDEAGTAAPIPLGG
jgi:excisionase family DNA binding protein